MGVVGTLLAAASLAWNSIVINEMRELHYAVVVYWSNFLSAIVFAFWWLYELYASERAAFESQGEAGWYWMEVFGSIIVTVLANVLYTICFAHENPTTVSVLSQQSVGFNFLIDLLVFDETFTVG